ncbi:MAG: glycosyltransferase family 4 protein [Schleiferiaceae bacterium]|nr:glycosyltransferase family 4 protein [Schleiferiaceae bacterium]
MRIGIYVTTLPTTVFINRLISDLTTAGQRVYVFGTAVQHHKKIPNVKYISYNLYSRFNLSKFFTWLRYSFLLGVWKAKEKKKLDAHLKENHVLSRHTQARFYPILWHKPTVFHVQWVKGVEDFLWVQEFGIKLLVSLRGSNIYVNPAIEPETAEQYRRVFSKLNGVHGVCRDIIRAAQPYGLPTSNAQVIYSGLPLQHFKFLPPSKRDASETLHLISVGRPSWVKGLHYAIEALARLQKGGMAFQYTIVGGAPPEELLYQVSEYGLQDRVRFVPQLATDAVIQHLQKASLLLLPSVSEGIANAAIEAMAVGTAVVASQCGGMQELITSGENGFLVAPRNPSAIASTIRFWSQLTLKEKDALANKGRATVAQNFTSERTSDAFLEFYQKHA